MARMVAALAAAALSAAAVAAQPDPSPTEAAAPVSYALLQISVAPQKIASGAFRTRMEAIRSCPEAVKVAGEIGAQVVRNARVAADSLPPRLQAALLDLPVGRATPLISGSGDMLRVVVLCHRS